MPFEFAADRVDDIGGEFVEPEVGNEGEAFARSENHRMRVRAALAGGVDARPLVGDEVAGRREAPVGAHGQHADTAAHEVGDEDVAAVAGDFDVAGIGAVGHLLVEKGQRPRARIDGESADRPGRAVLPGLQFIDRVEETARRVESQVRGIDDAARHAGRFERAGVAVEAVAIDALALALQDLAGTEKNRLGIGPDVDGGFRAHCKLLAPARRPCC